MSGNIIDINSRPITSDKERKLHIENILKHATNRAQALDRMARQQIGMPTQIRMELAACSVTIRVQQEQLKIVNHYLKTTEELLTNAQNLISQQEQQLQSLSQALKDEQLRSEQFKREYTAGLTV